MSVRALSALKSPDSVLRYAGSFGELPKRHNALRSQFLHPTHVYLHGRGCTDLVCYTQLYIKYSDNTRRYSYEYSTMRASDKETASQVLVTPRGLDHERRPRDRVKCSAFRARVRGAG